MAGSASQRSSSARPAGVRRWMMRSGLTCCGCRSESIRPSRESRSRIWYRWPMFSPPHWSPTACSKLVSAQASAPGHTVATGRTTAQQAYTAVLKGLDATTIQVKLLGPGRKSVSTGTPVNGYWSVGQVDYQPATAGALTARQVVNPPSVWFTGHVDQAAMDDEDSQYRTVTSHVKVTAQSTSPGGSPAALINVAGVFDPARIKSFDPLSRVPLGAYSPLTVAPATAASRRALHGGDLLPNQNVGGLVSQPVNLITTLSALPTLENSGVYTGVHAADPISVIRVRVAGVTRPDALSRERVN